MTKNKFVQIFPLGEKNDAYAQYFTGQSYLSMLTTERVGIANVTFEPGCRNHWHIHHKGGQILLCTAGRGYYQEWGKPAQEMNPGDVITIPPEAVSYTHLTAQLMRDFGCTQSPQSAFILNLGLESLHVRIPRHCENGQAVAEFLSQHPKIAYVNYCGLPGDKYHEIAKKYLPNGSCMGSTL